MTSASEQTTLNNMLRDPLYRNRDHVRKMALELLPGSSSQENVTSALKPAKSRVSSQRFGKTIKDQVKGRLSLGAKILQAGGTEKVFKRIFRVKEGEQLLDAFHSCLFTTAGKIAGILFISNENVAFCSHKSIKLTSPTGELLRFHYKVVIPLRNIARAIQTENPKKTSQKYLQIATMDDFEFWFTGFLNFKKMLKCLQMVITQA